MIAGTPMFMAPEQAAGDTLDHRADLFSLGSVLYTMCSGRPPFRASSTLAVLKRVAEDTPRPIQEIIPEVPQWLCDLIARLHAKKPEDRIGTAREVADLLGQGLAALQQPANVPLAVVAPVPVREGEAPAEPGARGSAGAAPSRPRQAGSAPAGTVELPKPAPALKPRPRTRRWAAAAVFLLLLGGLGFTEATGVTNVRGTVIRLFSPEGTLVVEVDDPGVSVQIDGSDLVITGAGAKEIRLKPGSYTVEGRKDGKVVSRELVTVTKNGKQVVKVRQESVVKGPDPKTAKITTDATAWETVVAAMPAEEQVKAVAARLKELNPGFDGKVEPTIENAVVRGLGFLTDEVTNIAPVRALKGLTSLGCGGSYPVKGKLSDLSPLKGMPLIELYLDNVQIRDLEPLKGMPLTKLNLGDNQIRDLEPLKGMSLTVLYLHRCPKVSDLKPLKGMKLTDLALNGCQVQDLEPLKGMPLTFLNLENTPVQDLTPLKGMPLQYLCLLNCRVANLDPLKDLKLTGLDLPGTPIQDLKVLKGMKLTSLDLCGCPEVRDLEPLKGMPLKRVYIYGTGVTDLKPLKGMELEVIGLPPLKNITQGMDILRDMKSLKEIWLPSQKWPAAEFWERYDKGEFADPDRRAAEYVLSIGGTVRVDGNDNDIRAPEGKLPAGAIQLTYVNLYNNKQVTDSGLAAFNDCKNLTFLDLSGCGQITDAGLAHFKDCKNLTYLGLEAVPVTAAGLAVFAGNKDLTDLGLGNTPVTDAGLVHFKDSKKLKGIRLLNDGGVTDAGLAHLKDCKSLMRLDLRGTGLTDEGLAYFKDCKDLINLLLAGTSIKGEGLAHITDCKNLTELNLSSTSIRDENLAHLKGHQKVAILFLSDTPVTDAGLAHLAGLKGLTFLALNGTKVSERGLVHLKGMPLNVLVIENTGVTDLTPLQGMPLETIRLTPKNITKGLDILRDMKSLKSIGIGEPPWPAAEFWERYGKGEFK